jgi:hypothetical protein
VRRLAQLEDLHIIHPKDYNMAVQRLNANPTSLLDMGIPPLGSLRGMRSLKRLTVSDLALFGGNGFDPGNSSWELEHRVQRPVLATLLPDSLQDLTILHHGILLEGPIRLLPRDPMVPQLERFMLYNCQQDRWMDQHGSESSQSTGSAEKRLAENRVDDIEQTAAELMVQMRFLSPDDESEIMKEHQYMADQELPLGEALRVSEALQRVRYRLGIGQDV